MFYAYPLPTPFLYMCIMELLVLLLPGTGREKKNLARVNTNHRGIRVSFTNKNSNCRGVWVSFTNKNHSIFIGKVPL